MAYAPVCVLIDFIHSCLRSGNGLVEAPRGVGAIERAGLCETCGWRVGEWDCECDGRRIAAAVLLQRLRPVLAADAGGGRCCVSRLCAVQCDRPAEDILGDGGMNTVRLR